MAKTNNLTDFLTDVANAIREKEGSSEAINPQDFVAKIRSIAGLPGVGKVNYSELDAFLLNMANTLREAHGTSEPINPQAFSAQILSIVITDMKLLPLFVDAIEPLTVSFSVNPIEYSLDNRTWQTLPVGASTPTIDAGERVFFRASGLTATSADGIGTFSTTGMFNVGGNIMSMAYGADFQDKTEIANNYAFTRLFRGADGMVDASRLELPAMSLTEYCYYAMFSLCTNLITGPKLPALNAPFFCYAYMYSSCSNLKSVCELPATILGQQCYDGMYMNCKNLEVAQEELPAEAIAQQSYGNMYRGCSSLKKSPILRAKRIAPYGFIRMFVDCSNLNHVTCYAESKDSSSPTQDWLMGVAAQGTIVKSRKLNLPSNNDDGIPSGWTVEYLD
jgi:hypothetical protein